MLILNFVSLFKFLYQAGVYSKNMPFSPEKYLIFVGYYAVLHDNSKRIEDKY